MSVEDLYRVAVPGPVQVGGLTAFGQLQGAPLTPIAGWTFAYNINEDMVSTTETGSGTVTHDDNFAVLSTTAAASSSATVESVIPLRYIPGQGGLVLFTAIFTPGVAGSQQIIGIGSEDDGFFFGYNGADFGVMRRRAGVDTWTLAADWSTQNPGAFASRVAVGEDPTRYVDPTKGNVYSIQFQWLGFGEIMFRVENPLTGELEDVHSIQYANQNVVTSIANPTLPLFAQVSNTTNDTAIVLKTPSGMAFVEGAMENPAPRHPFALSRALTASKIGITTETNVVTLQNQATFAGATNRVQAQIRQVSVGCEGNKVSSLRLVKNATLGGTPSFGAYAATRSPIAFDTAGTTVTGGTAVFSAQQAINGAGVYDLSDWGIYLAPGETLTVAAASSNSLAVDVAVNWVDLF